MVKSTNILSVSWEGNGLFQHFKKLETKIFILLINPDYEEFYIILLCHYLK